MASCLCNKCKIIHPKPWDKNCKGNYTEQTTMASGGQEDSGDIIDTPEGATGKSDSVKQLELYSQLLSTVKSLDSRFSSYDRRFDELAARIEKNNKTDSVKQNKASEPVFGHTTELEDGHRSKDKGKHGTRPKHRHASEPGSAPSAKALKHTQDVTHTTATPHSMSLPMLTHSAASGHTLIHDTAPIIATAHDTMPPPVQHVHTTQHAHRDPRVTHTQHAPLTTAQTHAHITIHGATSHIDPMCTGRGGSTTPISQCTKATVTRECVCSRGRTHHTRAPYHAHASYTH